MATLRDTFGVNNTLSGATLDQIRANDMGSLRRGWESGRLGNEANSLGAEWATANAEGDTAKADALRKQIDGLQGRQGIYRPEVAQIEDIKGIGDVPGYIAGQVGQGAASMVEPAAVATGLTAVGTGLRFIPNPVAQGAGTLLQTVGAPGAAFAINQKQLKGEFVNDAVRDEELMARTSLEQLNNMANIYGVGAGALDTVLPGMFGRTLGGATLRAGAREAAGSVGGRFVRNMLMEGGTETLQDMGSKFAQGTLNPNRDTSGDLMSYANSFVGGAVGSGPFAGAEALGDAGAKRVSGVAGAVKDAAGSVVDLAQPYAQAGMEKATAAVDKVRGKVIDLATGEDGTASLSGLKENLKATSQELKSKWQATQEERDLILGTPPADIVNSDDPLLQDKWMADNYPVRRDAIIERLGAMAETDERAGALYDALAGAQDQESQVAAVDAAADYIIGQTELGQLEKQATRFGELATKGGKAAGKAAVWAARKAGAAAKSFGSAVWDGVQEGSKKNAQRQQAMYDGINNAERMAEYLSTTAKSQGGKTASGPISNLLKDMGYEIAELADLSSPAALNAKPDLRRNLNSSAYSLGVNRIVNSLRVAYGPQTEQVINNLRQMAAPSAAPVFDAMAQELDAQRNDKSGAHTAQIRAASASELLGLMDAETETKLMREGINLRAPESQRQLLGMVEAVSLGRAAPQARKALEGLVGRDTLNKMLAAVAPQTEQDVEGDTLVDGGDVANEGFVVNDDGELSDATSSVYDQEAAEKMLAKGEGSRVYGFFGTGNRTDLNTKDPFAATTKLSRSEYKAFQEDNINRKAMGEDPLPDPRRRPRLFTKGQQLSEKAGGGSAMAKRIADMEKYLKVDRTPERMAALMEEEAKQMRGKAKQMGEKGNQAGAEEAEAVAKRAEAGAAKVRELIARGDEKAQATLDNAMKSFFVNRAGGWRVSAKSAWDVLKDQNAPMTKVLALYRDYLRQDGDNERAELANKTMLDVMDQSKGETTSLRVQAGTRRKIMQDAEAYFRDREIAVAERLSNRDPMKLDETELLQMHESAQKIVDLARKDGGNKMIAAANILTFKSDLSPNGKLLHIKVSDLVREVQKRQNESTGNDFENNSESLSNANKNQKYLDMVLEGVGMVMDSGRVDGWPYKLNDKNQKEYFGEGQNGVPPSLMLATTTNQGFLFGKEQRVAAKTGEKVPPMAGPRDPRSVEDARKEGFYPEQVAVEQERGFFVPDSRREQEPSGYETRRALSDEEYAHWNDLKTPSARSEYLAALREKHGAEWSQQLDEYGVHGTQFASFANLNDTVERGEETRRGYYGRTVTDNRTDVKPHWAFTEDNKTPLDLQRKPKGGKSVTGSLDEYADQRARSVSQGYDAAAISNPVERKGDAVARAAERAAPIVQALKDNFADGLALAERRLRTAQAPEFSKDKNTAVGGAHYVAPLAYALSAENVAMMDLTPAEAKQVQAMRVEVARVLLEGNFKQNERVALTRALATEEAAARIAAPNVNKYLAKVVGQQAPAKEAGASPAAKPTAKALKLDTPRDFIDSLRALHDVAVEDGSGDRAQLSALTGRLNVAPVGSMETRARNAALLQQVQDAYWRFNAGGKPPFTEKQDNMIHFLMKRLRTALDGYEAPAKEAGASLGKPQSEPSGAVDWSNNGRMRNAQAVEIHNDLGRSGFAATHDSPIRHDGKFDWRAHQGKGEGNAAFGAGTYLSTADGVHKSYKEQFSGGGAKSEYLLRALNEVRESYEASEEAPSAQDIRDAVAENLNEYLDGSDGWLDQDVREALHELRLMSDAQLLGGKSPTYQASVDIEAEQLLDWDKPFAEQSKLVQEAIAGELLWKTDKRWSGETSYSLAVGTTAFGKPIWGPEDNPSGKYLVASSPLDRGGDKFDTLAEAKQFVLTSVEKGPTLTGEFVYRGLVQRLGSQAKASDYLQSLGILGHKYAAAGGKNDKFPNYVIYDDSRIHTNYVHFNKQDKRGGSAQKSTQAERDAAVAEIRRTLGDKIKVEFADITGYSGEFIDADNLIRISTTPAAGTLQTAYHESLHAFFKQFVRGNPLAMDVVKALAEHKPTLDRVHALLDGYPEAQAALASGEERLAYMYQFWRADMLDLPYGKPRNLFQKVLKFFRQVLGRVSDLERSTELLVALRSGQLAGEPSVAGKVIAKTLNQGTWTRKQLRKMDGLTQMIAAAVLPANDVLANSDSLTAKKLAVTFWTNPGDETDGLASEGYLNARSRMAARYVNEFSRFIGELNDRDLKAVTTALQAEDDNLDSIAYAPAREAARNIRALIQRFRKYMVEEKGLKLGDRGPFYFPRAWDVNALMTRQSEFLNLLVDKYSDKLYGDTMEAKRQSAMRLFNTLITEGMVDDHLPPSRDDGVLTPYFAQGQTRDLSWLNGADIAQFQSKDAIKTLTSYFHAGARAAEYASRFGQDGKKLQAALQDVELELMQAAKKRERRGEFKNGEARDKWVERQMRDVRRSVDAMEGSIGKDGNMTMRKFGSAMTVYQNVRLLPLAIFSQVVDPLGMIARGATMKQAYESFLRGMKEVGQSWADIFREVPKERKPDHWEKLAMAVGSVDAAMFSHHVSEEYSSTYMSPTAKKINDTFFRLNGMEAWNRGMRVGATKAAVEFLLHHKGKPSEHSLRWLKDLGLSPADILTDDEGGLLTDWRSIKAKTGWDEDKARAHTDRVHYALNRWVQGAVLTPNAAQRPAWSSDPSYSMFFHLKQFSYSFHQTILKRAVKELEYGNLAPLGSFAWYIPAMIAADVTKGLMLNGGELPQHLKGMDLGDWVMHGIDRSGALGIGNVGVDAAGDIASLGGPAVEQIIDGMRDDIGATTLKALPAHGLYKAVLD